MTNIFIKIGKNKENPNSLPEHRPTCVLWILLFEKDKLYCVLIIKKINVILFVDGRATPTKNEF